MAEKRITLEEIAEMIPGGGKIETMQRVIDPLIQCPDGVLHDFQQVYGGTGGQRCIKCGHTKGAMSDEDYFKKLFGDGTPCCSD